MGKIINCNKVNPTSDCQHVVSGADEEEVLRNAAAHAKEHGLAPTPELLAHVKSFIEEEWSEHAQ
jgi:predicted small metal-binding protein